MIVKKLVFSSFRNLQKTDFSPGERFNVFHGNNGQGKTNILEAIYVLGTMKSFRHAKNRDLIRWEEPFSLLKGIIEKDRVTREVTLLIEKEGKKARVDRKSLERLSDFFGCLNVVVFSPEELAMVKGTPELRRRYLEVKISYSLPWNKQHLKAIASAYNKSPFFMYYQPELEMFFKKEYIWLLDFNCEIIQTCFKLLRCSPEIVLTEKYIHEYGQEDNFRESISPKIQSVIQFPAYTQVFDYKFGFIPNLSIIDLLFNRGPEALSYLKSF